MDEDISVKAPVTRLRRRLSVEAEDSPLPTTPSTPTKKRAARLAAKPQLELIDEVVPATENVPKRATRKAAVKENIEADTITGTPTPVTPSRRSTRIRSNTSILSETTTQNIESPRAKRALRRNSQLGSDTESSVLTPARPTRRTRKDSTTAVDKPAGDDNVVVNEVSSRNVEETEKASQETNEAKDLSPSTRKSPRLQNKKGGKTPKPDKEVNKTLNKSINNNKSPKGATPVKSNNDEVNGIHSPSTENDNLSKSNENLLNEMTQHDNKNNYLNKSTSAIENIANNLKNKRNRNKSWTTLTSPSSGMKHSNNEGIDEKDNAANTSITASGDGLQTSDRNLNVPKSPVGTDVNSLNKSINSRRSISHEGSIETVVEKLELENSKSDTVRLFEKSPLNQEPLVLIEDSDSGSVKLTMDTHIDGEDQCVPEVVNPTNESPKKNEQSVEEMDIDESMPANVTIDDFSDKSNTSKDDAENLDKSKSEMNLKDQSINKSKRKSSIRSETVNNENANDSINKSNRNLSISEKTNSMSDNESKRKSLKDKSNTSLVSQVTSGIDEEELSNISNKSIRKSSAYVFDEKNEKLNDSSNKSKRKSSVSINGSVNMNESTKSQGNTSISVGSQFTVDDQKDEDKPNMISNASIRKTSITLNNSDPKSSDQRHLSTSMMSVDEDNVDIQDKSLNKSNRKASISLNTSTDNQKSKEALETSKRKSSMSIVDKAEVLDGSSNKSRRKSSITLNNSTSNQKPTTDENNDSATKSNKNSSVSQTDLQSLENKSTLVISQLKDVSTNYTNSALSPNVTNSELSKSLNGPDIKNKGIDKKNLSLNYLTSTPIQQKPLQKLAMQINTSIISPGMESKNNTSEKTTKKNSLKQTIDSDFSDDTDEEIKFKNTKEVSSSKNSVSKKKSSRLPSSSESSEEESETESKTPTKKETKKTPIKNALDSSSSDDDETVSESRKVTKKTPNKKQNNQSISNSIRGVNKTKTPNKKPPSDSSDSSEESEHEASKDKSKMVDDEASDAGEDYESGDSQYDEDRRYEAENEIVEKGETLDSDDEFSNDSDYEKDSFIVSSEAEDNEMLSGTGDDLSLSDNELTMSAKSKSKFNERKLKQQKKASREMYKARHENDESTNSTKSEAKSKKSKRQRLESTLESENDNSQLKKSNRLRIDSSQEDMVKSDADESIGNKKKKSKRLSDSVHDITMNEKEITINQSITEKNDPLTVAIKQEPKTPLRKFNISSIAINDNIEEVQVHANASIMKQNESLDPLQATMRDDDDDSSSSDDNMEIIQNYDSVLNNLSMHTKKIKTADTSLNLNKKKSKNSKNPMIDQLNLTQVKPSKKNEKTQEKTTESAKITESSKAVINDEDSSDSIDMKLLFPEDSNDSEINLTQFKPKADEPEEELIPLKRTEAQTNLRKNMDTSETELNLSQKKSNKRKSSISASQEIPINNEEDSNIKIFIDTKGTHQDVEIESIQPSSNKKKNKKNKSLSESMAVEADIDCTDSATEVPVEILFTSEKKKKKNKNKSFDVSVNNIESSFTEVQSEIKRKNSQSTSDFVENQNENKDNTMIEEMPVNVSIKSEKKNKNKDVSQITESVPVEATSAKNTLISVEVETETQHTELEEVPAETSLNIEKKKKKNKKKKKQNLDITEVDITGEESDDAPVEMSYKREKKSDAADTVTDEAVSSTEKKKRKRNKKKKNKNSQSIEKTEDPVNIEQEGSNESVKRKRKATDSITKIEAVYAAASFEKKKRKIHLDDECIAAYDDTKQTNDDGSSKKSKKNKKNKSPDNNIEEELPQNNVTKKRKNRDEDNDEKINKVPKQNSFDKIHIPKIPESIIKQLAENPQNNLSKKPLNNVPKNKKKKNSAIATVPFVVEEAERRKNKPSNYLEQSIYLNDSPVKTKQKQIKDKPKVLPFTPTALTSDSGYTSKFNINVLPGQTQFVAQASNVTNFKESFLNNQRIKKMGTLERCKLHRSHKLSKF